MSDKLQDAINAFGQSLNPAPPFAKIGAAPAPSSSLLVGGPTHTSDEPLESHVGASSARPEAFQFTDSDIRQRLTKIAVDGKGVFLSQYAAKQIAEMLAAPALLSSGGPVAKVVRWVAPELEMPKPWQKVECAIEEGDGSGWEHPQEGRTYHRLTCCEWNPGSETQQAGWYAKVGKVMERLPDTCLVRLWLSAPQEDVPTFALREKLMAAPVSTSLGGGAAADGMLVLAGDLEEAVGKWGESLIRVIKQVNAQTDEDKACSIIASACNELIDNIRAAAADQLLVDSSGAGPEQLGFIKVGDPEDIDAPDWSHESEDAPAMCLFANGDRMLGNYQQNDGNQECIAGHWCWRESDGDRGWSWSPFTPQPTHFLPEQGKPHLSHAVPTHD